MPSTNKTSSQKKSAAPNIEAQRPPLSELAEKTENNEGESCTQDNKPQEKQNDRIVHSGNQKGLNADETSLLANTDKHPTNNKVIKCGIKDSISKLKKLSQFS